MIQVSSQTYSAIWGLIGVILAVGWVAYGMLGGGQVFLTIMVILSILLARARALCCGGVALRGSVSG